MERIGSVIVAPSTERKAEPGRFGAALRGAVAQLANGVASSVSLASPYVPGGAALAGALHGAALTARPTPRGGTPHAAPSAPAGGSSSSGAIEEMQMLQQQAQSFNLQYLELQEAMHRENRQFTAVSNVMKVKHDTARAAIDNVR